MIRIETLVRRIWEHTKNNNLMMKRLTFIFTFIYISTLCHAQISENNSLITTAEMKPSIHTFEVPGLTGDTIRFADFKGKKILIVNTASKCGYTPQYAELEKLYNQYKNKLIIVGFPANNFKEQEPGTNQEIAEFCTKNYGVTFPMAAKISVKGNDMAPIYKWLTQKDENGVMDAEIKWNFNKFLLDENGILIMKYDSDVKPLDPVIIKRI